jgi:purine-binding chemotaxis protein CheW
MTFLRFQVAEQAYAIDIRGVFEVVRMGEITSVPNTAGFMKGVIRLRGRVIPLVGLRERFGLTETDPGASSRIIICRFQGMVVGIVVDSVDNVVSLSEKEIEPPGDLMEEARYLYGIGRLGEGVILIVELEKLLSRDEEVVLSRAGA